MDKLKLQIKSIYKKGFIHLVVANYSIQIIVFAAHLLIAGIMSPYYVGVIKTIETYINIGTVLGSGGMIFAILKVVPMIRDEEKRRNIFLFGLRYISLFSVVLFLIFELLGWKNLISRDVYINFWFRRYVFLLIFAVALQYIIRYYQALQAFKKISVLIMISKLFSFILVLTATYYFHIAGYVYAMIGTTAVTVLFLLYDLHVSILQKTVFLAQKLKKELLKLSYQAFFAQIVDQIRLWGTYLLANFMIVDRALFGQYSFAVILVQGLNILSTSIQQFVIPNLSSRQTDIVSFKRFLKQAEVKYVMFTTIVFILAEVFFPFLVQLIFGDKYVGAMTLLRILLAGWYLSTFFALKGTVFLSLGKMNYISLISGILIVIILPTAYFLGKKWGVYGIAGAYVIQQMLNGGLLQMSIKKVFKSLT